MSKAHPMHLAVWLDRVQARLEFICNQRAQGATPQAIIQEIRESYLVLSTIKKVCSGGKAYFSGVPHRSSLRC